MKRTPARSLLVAVALLLPSALPAQVTLGQTDTFESGTDDWFIGGGPGMVTPTPPARVLSGGPHGVDDAFMNLVATGGTGVGSRLTVSNATQWAGDYRSAGVGRIGMWVDNRSATDLFLRLTFETLGSMGPTNIAFSADPVFVPAGSGWTRIFFPLATGDLMNFAALPGSTVEGAMTSTSLMRLYHSPDPNSPNPFFPIPTIAAELGVDDITALSTVPEPGTVVLLGSGLLAMAATWRRRRREGAD